MTAGAQRSAGMLVFALVDPSAMWIRQDQRHRVFELARHELGVEQGKLLVEQVRHRRRVGCKAERRRRESVQQGLGRDILDVAKHMSVFGFGIELGRSNLDVRITGLARRRMIHANADPTYELARSDAPSTTSRIVEAEQLGGWLDRNGTIRGLDIDLKTII